MLIKCPILGKEVIKMGRLGGKVATITGAGSGIGKATAKLISVEGAKIVVADINSEWGNSTVAEICKMGGEATFVLVDVTSEDSVRNLISTAVKIYGKLDIMCNNAGITNHTSVTECSLEAWERVMAVNVRGVFLGCKHAVPAMIANGQGSIINTASAASFIGVKERAAYCASKGAVMQLTRQVAVDYGQFKIRVNAVAPSAVDTPMFLPTLEKTGDVEKAKNDVAENHLLNHFAKPEEVALAILWLASDDSNFTTGSVIMVDGGVSAR